MEGYTECRELKAEIEGNSELKSRCSNCCRKYNKDCLPTRQFYYEFYENGVQVRTNVQISDAIKEIYEWRLFGFSESTLKDDSSLTQIRVCGNICGVAIAKLYGAIKVFDSLVHSNSLLESITRRTLNKFISFATTQCLVGGTSYKRKGTPNILTRKSKIKDDIPIGEEILNRPVTKHLKIEKPEQPIQGITLTEEPLIRILDPNEYQVVQEGDEHGPTVLNIHREPTFTFVTSGDDKAEQNSTYSHSTSVADPDENWVEGEIINLGDDGIADTSSSKPFLCQLCGAGLTSRQGLRTHELLTHKIATGKEKIFVCDHCGKEFFFEYLLKNHLPKHIGTRDFPCTSCDLKFKGRLSLRQHVKDVHSSEEKRFACKICPNKSFKHQRTLWDHNKSLHGNNGKKLIFACKYGCGSTTARSRSLLHHHRICLKRPREEELDIALKSIGGEPIPEEELEKLDDGGKRMQIYPCTYDCGRIFTTKLYRNRHSKQICRKRPNQSHESLESRHTPSSKRPTKLKKTVVVNEPKSEQVDQTPEDFVSLEAEEILDAETPEIIVGEIEAIEIETVFDETIIIP